MNIKVVVAAVDFRQNATTEKMKIKGRNIYIYIYIV